MTYLLHPRRGERNDGLRQRKQRLREVAAPDVAHAAMHRYGQQHAPERWGEVERRLLKVCARKQEFSTRRSMRDDGAVEPILFCLCGEEESGRGG